MQLMCPVRRTKIDGLTLHIEGRKSYGLDPLDTAIARVSVVVPATFSPPRP
jgi:hypothetical protein